MIRKHSYVFRVVFLSIFRDYQYLKTYIALLYSFVTCKW